MMVVIMIVRSCRNSWIYNAQTRGARLVFVARNVMKSSYILRFPYNNIVVKATCYTSNPFYKIVFIIFSYSVFFTKNQLNQFTNLNDSFLSLALDFSST